MVKPFLKWPGGKRWLVNMIDELIVERTFTRYFEPFLGGGAVFFHLQPQLSILSDINADLINTYQQVKQCPHDLITHLQKLSVDRETYNQMRTAQPDDPFERAVRFLYLNRTAFAGMYRLNRQGQFNVPFGGGQRTPAPLWHENLLQSASQALTTATLLRADFEDVIAEARSGDLVYCDPTFTVAHNNNGFIRYNESNFSWNDQLRLVQACQQARKRGAMVIVSNAFHSEVAHLYTETKIYTLTRPSTICPNPSKRQRVQEYLFVL